MRLAFVLTIARDSVSETFHVLPQFADTLGKLLKLTPIRSGGKAQPFRIR